SERIYKLYASYFIDCTGDGTVGAAAGAEYRYGRESRAEFGESLAPEQADRMTQGSSLMFRARDISKPVPFRPPSWAEEYPTEDSLLSRDHSPQIHPLTRIKEYAGYWWIEVGVPFDTIDQNEEIRDELLRHLLGVWDHIKNRKGHEAENMVIDWIGMYPAKRESRRLIGDYILTEHDVRINKPFPDRVAYGGWFIDIHTMGGILAKGKPPEALCGNVDLSDELRVQPYSIPLRCLYSKNIENLFMAGRDISVTHVALGSTRVMLTCAVIGQAAGTAAALCFKKGVTPRMLANNPSLIKELQQTLLKDDCFILDTCNEDPADLARKASVTSSSSMTMALEPIEGDPSSTYRFGSLEWHRSQIFPITESKIDKVSLFLESSLDREAVVSVEVMPATNIWSFNEPKEALASAKARVQSKFKGWVDFNLSIKVEPRHLYQINVYGEAGLAWAMSEPLPGVAAAYKKPTWKRWAPIKPVYAMRLAPPSMPFGPENVINGVARPEKWTNIWISDPNATFPQKLVLDFGEEIEFNTVYLTFDTNLHIDTTYWPPLHKAQECVRDYALKVLCNNEWRVVAEFKGNYHRRRIHRFDMVKSKKLMLEVYASNGHPTARLYEIRVYKE
ncbi:MAG: FAD-dependent oxidoreductase, partial [Candidatus Brockarchaeota archaeon]|nr:FAD-dependent oxidoreductase [Candidatus Brockarchaeota archaeon]